MTYEDLLDKDKAIQKERARLVKLQGEWKQKLGQAELELSVERAKLAREKAAMAEQKLALEEMSKSMEQSSAEKTRGRWLSALGLKEDEE